MAIIHDMIPGFELFQPANIEGALSLLDRHGEDAWVLAGGLDTMDWFKDRVKRPKVVVDVGSIPELRGVRETDDGIEIGALTSLTEIANDPIINERYGVLAEAARLVATPQIRNQASVGGNLSQDTRCWYYRGGWPCYRAGGNICYADTPTSMNREHCIFGASRCVAVSPSDTAPALIVLEGKMVVRNSGGERVINAEDFFMGPARDITRMTVMNPGDLLVSIRIPAKWAGKRFYFEKTHDRKSWDFALASVATALDVDGETIRDARVAVGAVAPTPLRLRRVENAIKGQALSEATAERAGQSAVSGARPLRQNGFKVPLLRNLVKRAVRA